MSKNNFNQNITTSDTEIVKQIQEIYKKIGNFENRDIQRTAGDFGFVPSI